MKYLLDTHYILWTLFEPQKISSDILKIFNNDEYVKYVSGISFWEISLKYSLNKLDLNDTNPLEIFESIKKSGFHVFEIVGEDMATINELPIKNNHKDPFDRLLIWQAIKNNLIFITQDKRIEQYQTDGLKLR